MSENVNTNTLPRNVLEQLERKKDKNSNAEEKYFFMRKFIFYISFEKLNQ